MSWMRCAVMRWLMSLLTITWTFFTNPWSSEKFCSSQYISFILITIVCKDQPGRICFPMKFNVLAGLIDLTLLQIVFTKNVFPMPTFLSTKIQRAWSEKDCIQIVFVDLLLFWIELIDGMLSMGYKLIGFHWNISYYSH